MSLEFFKLLLILLWRLLKFRQTHWTIYFLNLIENGLDNLFSLKNLGINPVDSELNNVDRE